MSERIAVGKRVRVKPGVQAPEVPEVNISGWTGTVTQISKKKSGRSCFIEWDDATMAGMPDDYVRICEEQMLLRQMACLPETDLESAD